MIGFSTRELRTSYNLQSLHMYEYTCVVMVVMVDICCSLFQITPRKRRRRGSLQAMAETHLSEREKYQNLDYPFDMLRSVRGESAGKKGIRIQTTFTYTKGMLEGYYVFFWVTDNCKVRERCVGYQLFLRAKSGGLASGCRSLLLSRTTRTAVSGTSVVGVPPVMLIASMHCRMDIPRK